MKQKIINMLELQDSMNSKVNPDWRAAGNEVDICNNNLGKDVDVYFTCEVKTMVEIWMGGRSYKKAVVSDSMKIVGPKALTNDVASWMTASIFADIAPASEI